MFQTTPTGRFEICSLPAVGSAAATVDLSLASLQTILISVMSGLKRPTSKSAYFRGSGPDVPAGCARKHNTIPSKATMLQ